MLPYIIAGAVAVLLLVGAYRTLGGAQVRPVDPMRLMRVVHDAMLQAVVDSEHVMQPRLGGAPAASAAQVRRRVDGCGQQLQQVDVAQLDDTAATAHALLSTAVDDLSWCLRLAQSPAHTSSSGVQEAARTLCAHAAACVEQAGPAVLSVGAEEVERAR